jgi:hypothetical protein
MLRNYDGPLAARPQTEGGTMNPIQLTVLLHGLIALVPRVESDGNHMTALLLDAQAPSAMECMGVHRPKLTTLVNDNTGCQAAGCHLTGSQCDCTDSLVHKLIRLEITPTPDLAGRKPNNRPPINGIPGRPPEIPSTPDEAVDFAYVANLSQPPFNLKLDQGYLSDEPPVALLARVDFPFKNVFACGLATRENKGEAHVQSLSFHRLHLRGTTDERSQALAQVVVMKLDVPDSEPDVDQVVTLLISDFDGTNGHELKLGPGKDGFVIDLSNEADVLGRDSQCEDGVGRHFDHFYDLADTKVTPHPLHLIPHVLYGDGPTAQGLLKLECNFPTLNLMDRPICPMAAFDNPNP